MLQAHGLEAWWAGRGEACAGEVLTDVALQLDAIAVQAL